MINVVYLNGCSKCQKLKQQLERQKKDFIAISCDDNPSLCDYIEVLIDSYNYPIVLIKNELDKITDIFYITDKYEEIGKHRELNDKIKTLAFYSIDNLISYAIKL